MELSTKFGPISRFIQGVVGLVVLVTAPQSPGATLWTGTSITFSQTVASATSKDVLIPGSVSFTRANRQWLFNPDGGDTGPAAGTPSNTQWAFATGPIGSLADVTNLAYKSFDLYRNGDLTGVLLPNKQMVVHLLNQDIYVPIKFTAWPHGGGRFAYVRSTPAAAPPAPTVTITNPVNGAIFASPAILKIDASATVTSGSVTNVAFYANGLPLGFDETTPFSLTTGSLADAAYALTAVATAGGVSGTSAVVNVTVVSPVSVSLSPPAIAGGQFVFDYSANPGLSYLVENSLDLVVWLPVVTNVAASDPVQFSDGFHPNGALYYRVGRLPNP